MTCSALGWAQAVRAAADAAWLETCRQRQHWQRWQSQSPRQRLSYWCSNWMGCRHLHRSSQTSQILRHLQQSPQISSCKPGEQLQSPILGFAIARVDYCCKLSSAPLHSDSADFPMYLQSSESVTAKFSGACRGSGKPQGLAGPDQDKSGPDRYMVHGRALGAAALLVVATRSGCTPPILHPMLNIRGPSCSHCS